MGGRGALRRGGGTGRDRDTESLERPPAEPRNRALPTVARTGRPRLGKPVPDHPAGPARVLPVAASAQRNARHAPVAQGIEQRPPEPCAQVRILPGAHCVSVSKTPSPAETLRRGLRVCAGGPARSRLPDDTSRLGLRGKAPPWVQPEGDASFRLRRASTRATPTHTDERSVPVRWIACDPTGGGT